jgi:hypothetical protein
MDERSCSYSRIRWWYFRAASTLWALLIASIFGMIVTNLVADPTACINAADDSDYGDLSWSLLPLGRVARSSQLAMSSAHTGESP